MVRWWSCSWFVCTHRTQKSSTWQRCCMGDKRAVFEVLSFMSRLFLSCLYLYMCLSGTVAVGGAFRYLNAATIFRVGPISLSLFAPCCLSLSSFLP